MIKVKILSLLAIGRNKVIKIMDNIKTIPDQWPNSGTVEPSVSVLVILTDFECVTIYPFILELAEMFKSPEEALDGILNCNTKFPFWSAWTTRINIRLAEESFAWMATSCPGGPVTVPLKRTVSPRPYNSLSVESEMDSTCS